MSANIFFLGLNNIGASIGMALAKPELEINRIGYDPDRQQAQHARRAGAVDDLVSNPGNAAEKADIVILSTSIVDVHDYLKILGPRLQTDSVVLDTSALKVPSMAWAAEELPEGCHYIGATPIVGPASFLDQVYDPTTPRADLLHGGLMAIVVPKNTPETAVTVALNLAAVLGATPFFLDPREHDAVIATVEGLPCLIGTVLMQMATHALNWRETQRMAGPLFNTATGAGSSISPEAQAATFCLNHEIMLYKIDALLEEIHKLRALISNRDNDALKDYLTEAVGARAAWITARQQSGWASQELQPIKQIERPGIFRSMFGLRSRRPTKPDEDHR